METTDICEHDCINPLNNSGICKDFFKDYLSNEGAIINKLNYTYSSAIYAFGKDKIYCDTHVNGVVALQYFFNELVEAIFGCKKAKEIVLQINGTQVNSLFTDEKIIKMRKKVHDILYGEENNISKIIEICEKMDEERETNLFTSFAARIDSIYGNIGYNDYFEEELNEKFNDFFDEEQNKRFNDIYE